MSRTYRHPGTYWRHADPKDHPEITRDRAPWTLPNKLHKLYNRIDRRRWNREALKPEPQLPRNHFRWGIWNYQ